VRTGALHEYLVYRSVGGFRTAFFAYLFAKKHGGKFLLRIEDTDRERLVPGSIRFIIEELGWLGISIDEGPSRAELKEIGEDWNDAPNLGGECGPYIQSLRLPRYKEVADLLIEKGFAYRCDCTAEMLERERAEQMARRELPGYSGYCRTRNVPADKPHVVRFKMPTKRALSFVDAIRGRVNWDTIPLRDTVLRYAGYSARVGSVIAMASRTLRTNASFCSRAETTAGCCIAPAT
jgi:glutamyl/glutaminyl-tRNA synthetase